MIYNYWYHLYIDSIYQLLISPSKWEKSGQLPQIDDIILFMFTDLGCSKKSVVWKLGQVVASTTRSTSSSYVSKPTITGPSQLEVNRRNPRDVSVIYANDEFHVNTPEHYAQVTIMFYLSFVRMAGALKIHLHPVSISSKIVKKFFESVKFNLGSENIYIFCK